MQTCCIGLAVFHVRQYGLFEKCLRYQLHELLFAEVAGIQALGTVIDAEVHNIVIVHILHLHTVLVECPSHHLIARRVDGDIPVVARAIVADYRVRLHLMRIGHHRRCSVTHIE